MDERFYNLPCSEFVQRLSSKAAVPGGGGASALAGALGTALAGMVGNLTLGKKGYEMVQGDVALSVKKAALLQTELLAFIDADAEAFAPLAKAYGLPKDTEEARQKKSVVLEKALKGACAVPLAIMERCCEAIELLEPLAEKGAVLALSDVGCAAALCRAALQSASLNVLINTASMQDRSYAERINRRAHAMLTQYIPVCDAVFAQVANRFEQ